MKKPGIPLDDCVDRRLYKINGRNLGYGVFRVATKGFLGLRDKFGLRIDHEYHYDCGPPYGTVCGPIEDTGIDLPNAIPNTADLGSQNELTGRWIVHDDSIPNPNFLGEDRMGWWTDKETGKPCGPTDECQAVGVENKAMFDWLVEQERQFGDSRFATRQCAGCGEKVTLYDPCACEIDFDYKGSRCRQCWRPRDGWLCEICDATVIAARKTEG